MNTLTLEYYGKTTTLSRDDNHLTVQTENTTTHLALDGLKAQIIQIQDKADNNHFTAVKLENGSATLALESALNHTGQLSEFLQDLK